MGNRPGRCRDGSRGMRHGFLSSVCFVIRCRMTWLDFYQRRWWLSNDGNIKIVLCDCSVEARFRLLRRATGLFLSLGEGRVPHHHDDLRGGTQWFAESCMDKPYFRRVQRKVRQPVGGVYSRSRPLPQVQACVGAVLTVKGAGKYPYKAVATSEVVR